MATISRFEDLDVWKLAREQANEIYKLTKRDLMAKDFELKNQMNASSGSIMDCIAEGFERSANGEFKYFLGVAKGSNGELRSQLFRTLDRGYFTQNEFNSFHDRSVLIGRKINALTNYLLQSSIKGQRYNESKK